MLYKINTKATIRLSSKNRPLMSVVFPEVPVPEIMIPRQGEQCPVVELSYMGYSPPKCTCNDSTQTHSRKYMILLECLHAQSRVSSPYRLIHTCLSQMREKHRFHFFHAMHSHLIFFLGCHSAYEMHYANSKQFMLIYFTCMY